MKRLLSLSAIAALILAMVAPASAQAEGFFGVLAPQSQPVSISLSASSIKLDQSASATASGGSGDGSFSFATTTAAKCSVNSSGAITPIATGACTLTATKASSGTFLQRTSNPVTLTITAVDGTEEEEEEQQTDANGNLISATAKPTFSSDVDIAGTKALVTWKLSSKVSVRISSKLGESRYEGFARSEEGGALEIPGLEPGYKYTITVSNEDEQISQVFTRSVAPLKVTKVSGLSATKATNYAFIVKWQPQSYVEYYKIEVSGLDDIPLTYYSKSPDFYLFDRTARSYLFAVSAQGEGGEFSEPVRFRASLTAPVNISSKLPTNPATNRLTTATSNQLTSIANRLTAQTVVTVTTYFDPKVKGAQKLAQTRSARAAATIKVAKPTLVVKTQVRKLTTVKSLSQIVVTSKAPARKLTLSNA